MSVEQDSPNLGWLEKLEQVVGNSQVLEIEYDEGFIIVKRIDKAKHPTSQNDWCVEIRNYETDNISHVKTETYYLNNQRGLVNARLTAEFGVLPNIAGIDFNSVFDKLPDGSEFQVGIGETRYNNADAYEYNLRAYKIVEHIGQTLDRAKFMIRSGFSRG